MLGQTLNSKTYSNFYAFFEFSIQIIYRGCRIGHTGVGAAPPNRRCRRASHASGHAPAGDYMGRAGGDALREQHKGRRKNLPKHDVCMIT
jgi:hypothetical protein